MKKHFDCDCNWPGHSLTIDIPEDTPNHIEVFITNSFRDLNLWNRIKSAWAVLVGNDHVLSEVVLERSQVDEFIEFTNLIKTLRDPGTIGGARSTACHIGNDLDLVTLTTTRTRA